MPSLSEDLGCHVARSLLLAWRRHISSLRKLWSRWRSFPRRGPWIAALSAPHLPSIGKGRTPKSASIKSASSALFLKRMFSGFKSGVVRRRSSHRDWQRLTAVHDPLVMEVFDGGDDGSDDVGRIPICQRIQREWRRTSRSKIRGRRYGRRARRQCTSRIRADRRQRHDRAGARGSSVKGSDGGPGCIAPSSPPSDRSPAHNSTHIEVVGRLEEVMQLHNVRVALRDLLEDLNLVADLSGLGRLASRPGRCRGPNAGVTYHMLTPLSRQRCLMSFVARWERLTVRNFLFKTLHA